MRKDLTKARRQYQAAGRPLRWHLYRHGRAPIALMRRLGMAVIAGRKEGDTR
jgi:hypothetical protein